MDQSFISQPASVPGSEALADLLDRIRFESIPASAVAAAKRLILDSLACMYGGSQMAQGRQMTELMTPLSGPGRSTVAGSARRLASLQAGYLNAYLANLLDFDDTYFGHPGATVIPPALALAEELGLDGRQLLVAVAGGYEVGLRIADAIKPSRPRLKKVMGLSTWQVFCAAAAAAKALGLNRDQIVQALSLAAHHAQVPSVRKLGLRIRRAHWLKNNYGWAVMGGILAALSAGQGFIGDPSVFDGPTGFWVMAGSDRYRPAALSPALPQVWAVERVSIKPYSACRHINPTLDAVYALAGPGRLAPENIKKINVFSFFELAENYNFFPEEPFSIPFSAPCLIALALLGLPTGLAWFDPAHLTDPRVRGLAERVSIHDWAEADRLYSRVKRELISRVIIETAAGERLEAMVRLPKGDPRNPLSDQELGAKFLSLVEPVLGAAKAARLRAAVLNLEEVEDWARLSRDLTA